jgi:tRNA U34 5-carboxymethylaminomethyl modifying GTPase MnmE/TrmE
MRLYAVKAHVGLCLYSANVQDWIAELQILNATILIVIVVSKRDLKSVYTQDARDFAKRNNFVFFEVSALTGFGIDTMFETCSEMILSQKQRPSALILESEESLLDRPQEHCCNIL